MSNDVLPNGFVEVNLKIAPGLPGQYILIDNNPIYLSGETQIIIPKSLENKLEAIPLVHGTPIEQPDKNTFTLLIAQNAFNACFFYLKKFRSHFKGLILIGSDSPFPFLAQPSRMLISGIESHVMASIPLLEDWELPHRLASTLGLPGCYEGSALQLAKDWQASQNFDYKTISIR